MQYAENTLFLHKVNSRIYHETLHTIKYINILEGWGKLNKIIFFTPTIVSLLLLNRLCCEFSKCQVNTKILNCR